MGEGLPWDPLDLFYDPTYPDDPRMHDPLDALERSIESPPAFGDMHHLDPIGRTLDRVEAEIEGGPFPPSAFEERPLALPTDDAMPMADDFRDLREPHGPRPHSEAGPEHDPLSAPFVVGRDYAGRAHASRIGRWTGASRGGTGAAGKTCPETSEIVDEEDDCPDCQNFSDWSDIGSEECYYDWIGLG